MPFLGRLGAFVLGRSDPQQEQEQEAASRAQTILRLFSRPLLYHFLTELSIHCTEVASLPLINRSEPKESILVIAHPFKYQSTSTKVCQILVRKWDCRGAGFEGQ